VELKSSDSSPQAKDKAMAYRYDGPSLAAGGKLVKKGSRPIKAQAETSTKKTSIFTPEEWAERLAPGWDERGWHGGGECKIRNMKQKTRPSKGNTWRGRQAHPNILRLTK